MIAFLNQIIKLFSQQKSISNGKYVKKILLITILCEKWFYKFHLKAQYFV
jgi:hypothetical protein